MTFHNPRFTHPTYTTLWERVQGYLASALDTEKLDGPGKWLKLEHFTDYALLVDGERQVVEPGDLVLLVTPQSRGKACGYVLKHERDRIELCMPNPANEALAGSFRAWMNIGSRYPSETFYKEKFAFDDTLVLRKHK